MRGSINTYFVVGRIPVPLLGKNELLALQDEELGADLQPGGLRAALAIAHVHNSIVKLLEAVKENEYVIQLYQLFQVTISIGQMALLSIR